MRRGPQFGKVQRGLWRGTVVAVKTMILPANMTGQEKREKMAVMEAAISSSLVHPNIGELDALLTCPDVMLPACPTSSAQCPICACLCFCLAVTTYTYFIRPYHEPEHESIQNMQIGPG